MLVKGDCLGVKQKRGNGEIPDATSCGLYFEYSDFSEVLANKLSYGFSS